MTDLDREAADLTETNASRWQPYPEYKDSGVEWLSEIPAHWRLQRLKTTITLCQNGIWGDEPQNDESDTICIRVADFDRVTFRIKFGEYTLRSILAKQREERLLHKGDLLLEKSGGGELQPVGAVVLFDLDTPAVCSNFVARVKVADGYSARFLTYLHATLYSKRVNTRSIKQNTGIQNLDSSQYFNETVGLPNLPEQRAIASFLDHETAEIDALIAKKRELIALLQEQRSAIISHAVTKGLNPDVPMKDSGIEWIGEIPEHWHITRLKYLSESIQTGPFGSQLHAEEYITGGIPVINPSHISNGQIIPDEAVSVDEDTWRRLSRHYFREGDIVFARRGEMGRCGLVQSTQNSWICGTGSLRVRLKPIEGFPDYINIVLTLRGIKQWLELASVGSTLDNLNTTIVGNISLPVPPKGEQVEIFAYLERETAQIDVLILKTEDTIDQLQEYRAALISAAVTGKIDVREEAL